MQEFKGRTAVITGGANGIGRALADTFASQGMGIVLADIEQDALDAAVSELESQGVAALGVATDVSSAEQVEALADRAFAEFGAVHVVCNNAGVFTGGLLWEESLADFKWSLDVNLWGVIHGIRSFIPRLIEQGCDCHMVNTASMAAVTSMPYAGIYHMTKHAVLALSESLFHELSLTAPQVKLSVLCPELVRTTIDSGDRNRPQRYKQPGDVIETEARQLVMNSIREGVAAGVDPNVLAARVLQAIRDEQFYILSEDGWRESAHTRLEDIRLARNPTLAPPIG